MKTTLVVGASTNTERYSNLAVRMLLQYNHKVYAIGNVDGRIYDIEIIKEKKHFEDIHTVTLYINPKLQKDYYDYIFSLNPQRIIFNPGTENEELFSLAKQKNIDCFKACTLVLLKSNQY
jgi:predicted CoA-binding protein